MRLLVCGSRDAGTPYQVQDELGPILFEFSGDVALIHGDCRGVDRWAAEWAKSCNLPVSAYPVDEKLDGPWPAAGPRRNRRMLDTSKPDLVLAFWDGHSRGTRSTVEYAVQRGIPVRIVPVRRSG